MHFSPAALLVSVREHLQADASGSLCVAFSGGLDSTVLLTALAQAVRDTSDYRLRAVHVDHRLQEQSQQWDSHCGRIAHALGVEYLSRTIQVVRNGNAGLESSARDARYAALSELLRPGETLLTAHHADDQMETVLLALLRGAGLKGLSAMPACQVFGHGWHVRPLLGFTRADLDAWAAAQGIRWIRDPSNEDSRFSRNFLRNEITPRLQSRWPAAAESAARSACHIAEGVALLDQLAEIDLVSASVGPCLQVAALAALSPERRRNLLRFWVGRRGARAPSTRKLFALEHDMLAAQDDRLPVIEWDGFEVRRFRGLLYAGSALSSHEAAPLTWDWSSPLQLPDALGSLRTESGRGTGLRRAGLPQSLRLDFRHGGESLRPVGQVHHRKLKTLLQEADILPWWRSRLPLIWIGDELAAVGDLWVAEDFAASGDEASVQVVWQDRPQIRALLPAK